jgi:hypothetical protein
VVVGTLSRKIGEDESFFTLSLPIPSWLEETCREWLVNDTIVQLIHGLQEDPNPSKGHQWQLDTLRYKGRIVMVKNSTLKHRVLEELHSSPTVGHSIFHKNYERYKCLFFWEGMKTDNQDFGATCHTCQRNKGENMKMPRALQPLSITMNVWTNLYMDFIMGHPKASNKSMIMVVIDQVS